MKKSFLSHGVSTGFLAILVLLLYGCGDVVDEAKEAIAEYEAAEAVEDEGDCSMYLDQYEQTGKDQWIELYDEECLDKKVDANTPEGLSADCETKYEKLFAEADSIARSLKETCETGAETKAECKDAQVEIEALAQAFVEECDPKDGQVFVPGVDEYAPDTQTSADGECYWTAWIPEETRMEGQSENVDVKCTDGPPECVEVVIGDNVMMVEEHTSLDGDPVYLPCIEHIEYAAGGLGPCDYDQNGLVEKHEAEKCEEEGIANPCDFNQDGVVDEWEKGECSFYGDSGFVDPNNYDQCDWNFDGIVDAYEHENCYGLSGCEMDEVPFWDPVTMKDVCVDASTVPECKHPSWPEYRDGAVMCVHPCDWNFDGEVDSMETEQCNFIECPEGEGPAWDRELQKDVCVNWEEAPMCEYPKYPEVFGGEWKCIDPCDWNADGTVDSYEEQNCTFVACEPGTMPIWDGSIQKDKCVPESEYPTCTDMTWPAIIDGTPGCADQCDWNADGIVDDYESSMCMPAPAP